MRQRSRADRDCGLDFFLRGPDKSRLDGCRGADGLRPCVEIDRGENPVDEGTEAPAARPRLQVSRQPFYDDVTGRPGPEFVGERADSVAVMTRSDGRDASLRSASRASFHDA